MADTQNQENSRRRTIRWIAGVLAVALLLLLLRNCRGGAPEEARAPVESPVGGVAAQHAAEGMQPGIGRTVGNLAADGPASLPSVSAGPEVARVAALLRNASAQLPGQPPRALECGDPVYAGERVVTEARSRLGLLSDLVYVQLNSDTAFELGLTARGGLDVTLETGSVRVIDSRTSGPPGRLAVADAEAAILGADAEAYSFAETGRDAMICARKGTLEITRGGARRLAAPDGCVAVPTVGALLATAAPKTRIPLPQSAEEECRAATVLNAAALRFMPVDVALGPTEDWNFVPPSPDRPDRVPCGVPGSGCDALASTSQGGGQAGGTKPDKPKTLPGPLRSPIPPRGLGSGKGTSPMGNGPGPSFKGGPKLPGVPGLSKKL